jgi:hypothetical protein
LFHDAPSGLRVKQIVETVKIDPVAPLPAMYEVHISMERVSQGVAVNLGKTCAIDGITV